VIDERGYVDLVGIRFKAGGAWPFLGLPISELTGHVVELDAVLGREAHHLSERMNDARKTEERFALLQSWLLHRLQMGTPPTPAVKCALGMIRNREETVRIGQIADKIGVSHKHLLREFDRCVGLPPKMFARLSAFQRAIGWIGHQSCPDWADVATGCGYYDQAHFIHEFRAFSGLTPSTYLSRRGPYLNYLAVE
jgi:AraC-like DNA-binding protein